MTITADSWIHGAPVQWTRGRIKNLIASATNGTWGGEPAEDGSDVRCIRAADFDRVGRRAKVDGAPLRTIDASSLRQHLLRPGDLILEKSGGGEKQPVGMAVLYEGAERAVCSNFCARISPAMHVDSRFLTYVFAAAYGQGLTQSAIKQTTGIQNLDAGTFFSSAWAYPELEEQRRIADFLDAETARIDRMTLAAERGCKLLVERRWTTVHTLVTGSDCSVPRRDPGLGWVQEVPTSWPVMPLKFVASLGSGHTPSRSRPEYWQECTIPWISLFDVGRMRDVRQTELAETAQQISELGMANSSACLHPAGTVVLSRTASVGFSTIMGVEMAVSQHFVTWTCGDSLLPTYLLQLLRAMRQYFESVQVGTTNVTVFMPDLYSIRIPLPPLAEQEAIVDRIDARTREIDALASRFDRQVSLLKERRQALITAAVTGQFDVSTASGRNVTDGVSA